MSKATGRGLKHFAAASSDALRRGSAASVRGLRIGSMYAGAGLKASGRWIGRTSASSALWTGGHLATAGRFAGAGLSNVGSPLLDFLGRPGVSGPLMLAGGVALLSGLARPFLTGGIDREAVLVALIGAICLLAGLAPRLRYGPGSVIAERIAAPFRAIPPRVGQYLAGGGAILAVVLAGFWLMPSNVGLPSLPSMSLSSFVPFKASDPPITGRASVVAGDMLRIGETMIRIDGVEAPDREQSCARSDNRRWRCGEAAQSALSRLISGKQVRCEPISKDSSGVLRATCFIGSNDVAAALVTGGHVLAESGMLARYRAEQGTAREAKAGLWGSSGEPERPAAWRSRLWEEARAKAPQGCPIKGKVVGRRGEKTYHLPWSPSYERARVVSARGERWFCSEEDARAAGFAPSSAVDG
jgi:endonuclease YncB( thermonuclease family)